MKYVLTVNRQRLGVISDDCASDHDVEEFQVAHFLLTSQTFFLRFGLFGPRDEPLMLVLRVLLELISSSKSTSDISCVCV
jgi:hypothetical protein